MRAERRGQPVDDAQHFLDALRWRLLEHVHRQKTTGHVRLGRARPIVGERRNEVVVLRWLVLETPAPEVVPGVSEAVDLDRHFAGDEIVARNRVALQRVGREEPAGPQIGDVRHRRLAFFRFKVLGQRARGVQLPVVGCAKECQIGWQSVPVARDVLDRPLILGGRFSCCSMI